MPDLKKLREDIEKFPQRRSEINLQGNFREYSQKVGELYLKLKTSIEDAKRIEKSSGKENFDKNGVLSEIKTATREAKKLKKSIEEDANSVASKATENAVERMNDKAIRTSTKCRDGWRQHIDRNATKWTQIATVLERFPSADCRDFKNAVRDLMSARDRIPQSEQEVDDAKKLQEELQQGISKLGLEGDFGKFLENASTGNCSLKQALVPEIKKKLDEFDLWDTFQITL